MPKRIVDGEALWGSDKIAAMPTEAFRAEYANLIPCALANGVFECEPKKIWRLVYSFNRPSMTEERTASLLNELERVRLLFRWSDEAGKVWGFWVGIDASGRLPSKSAKKRDYKKGLEPPEDLLRRFLLKEVDSGLIQQAALRESDHGKPMGSPCSEQEDPLPGIGIGSGLGIGFGVGTGVGEGGATRALTLSRSDSSSTELQTLNDQSRTNGENSKELATSLQRRLTHESDRLATIRVEDIMKVIPLMREHTCTEEDVCIVFSEFFYRLDHDNIKDLALAGRDFAERADALLYSYRRRLEKGESLRIRPHAKLSNNAIVNDPRASTTPQVSENILSGDACEEHDASTATRVQTLSAELAYLSDNTVVFTDREKRKLATLLSEGNTAEELTAAWKVFLGTKDTENTRDMGFAARNFVEAADQLVYSARRKKQGKAAEEAQVDQARILLEQTASREAAEREQRRREREAEEEQQFETDFSS